MINGRIEQNRPQMRSVEAVAKLQFRRQAGTDRGPFQSRPKVPIQKLSPSRSVKTEIHAPGFYEFAKQILFYARCRANYLKLWEYGLFRQTKQTANAVCFCVYAVKSCAQYAVPFTTVQPMPMVVKLLLRMFARWPDELIHDWTTASGVL